MSIKTLYDVAAHSSAVYVDTNILLLNSNEPGLICDIAKYLGKKRSMSLMRESVLKRYSGHIGGIVDFLGKNSHVRTTPSIISEMEIGKRHVEHCNKFWNERPSRFGDKGRLIRDMASYFRHAHDLLVARMQTFYEVDEVIRYICDGALHTPRYLGRRKTFFSNQISVGDAELVTYAVEEAFNLPVCKSPVAIVSGDKDISHILNNFAEDYTRLALPESLQEKFYGDWGLQLPIKLYRPAIGTWGTNLEVVLEGILEPLKR